MRAVRVATYGEPEVLRIDEIPIPKPAAGEGLLKVMACGINPLDGWFRSGHLAARFGRPMPYTPGTDIVGTVVDGGAAAGLAAGSIALGVISPVVDGGYAEYAIVPVDRLIPLPDGVEPVAAAAVMTPGITGVQLVDKAVSLSPCKRLLILGALGSVGRTVVAEALSRGLDVSAVVRPGREDATRALGIADIFVSDGVEAMPEGAFDTVIDAVGPSLVAQWQNSLTSDAVILTIVPLPPATLSREGIQTIPFAFQPNPADLGRVLQLLSQGRLSSPDIKTVTFDEARFAHERLFAEGYPGKFVLVP